MLKVSAIGGEMLPVSDAQKRLREINLSIATIDERRNAKRRQLEAEVDRLQRELANVTKLGDTQPVLRAIRRFVSVLDSLATTADLGPTPGTLNIPAGLETRINVVRSLVDPNQNGDPGPLKSVPVTTLVQLLSRTGALEPAEFTNIIALGDIATTSLDFDALLAELNVFANGLSLTDQQLEDGGTLRTTSRDEIEFINRLREYVKLIDAARAIDKAKPDPQPVESLLEWYDDPNEYLQDLNRKSEIFDELETAQASLNAINQAIQTGPDGTVLDKLVAIRDKMISSTRSSSDMDPLEQETNIHVQKGDQLDINFYVEGQGTIAIQLDLLDEPWSNQYRAEAPDAQNVQELRNAVSDASVVLPVLQDIEQRLQAISNLPGLVANIDIAIDDLQDLLETSTQMQFASAIQDALDNALELDRTSSQTTDSAILDPIAVRLEDTITDLLAAVQAKITFYQRAPADYRAALRARETQPWRLANTLASLQDKRDQRLAFSLFLNDQPQGLLFTGTQKQITGNGRVSIRAKAESYHSGHLGITVSLLQPGAVPPGGGAPALEEINQIKLLGHVQVSEICDRCGERVVALDQEEFGQCRFSIGLTSWEKAQGITQHPKLRLKIAQFRGWHCATSYLIRPVLNDRARPDEWVFGDYSHIRGSQVDGYPTQDLRIFQIQQARGLGAPENVTVPITEQDLRLFDPNDDAVRNYLYVTEQAYGWLANLRRPVVPLGFAPAPQPSPSQPSPSQPQPPPPSPSQSQPPQSQPQSPSSPSQPPPPPPSSPPPSPSQSQPPQSQPQSSSSPSQPQPPQSQPQSSSSPSQPPPPPPSSPPPSPPSQPQSPQPQPSSSPSQPPPPVSELVRKPSSPVDREVLKGKTEVFESEPEPEPVKKQVGREPTELEKKFAKAMTIDIVEPKLEPDGTYGDGYLKWLDMMRGYTNYLADLEQQLIK